MVAPKNNIGGFTRYLKNVLIFLKPPYDGVEVNHHGFSQWFFNVLSYRVDLELRRSHAIKCISNHPMTALALIN